MICVLKAKSLKHAYARLRVAGLRVNVDDLDEPKGKIEEACERTCTPHLLLDGGDVVFSIRVNPENVAKIPTNDTPNFGVIWRADQNTEEEWPHFTITTADGPMTVGATRIV